MRPDGFSTVFTSPNCRDAEAVLKVLKRGGLHPADLGMTATIAENGNASSFPIEVPADEAQQARKMLRSA
jgi:hypothetical protein